MPGCTDFMHDWLEKPVIREGQYYGKQPRGAGVIAIMDFMDEQMVCVGEKRNGKISFPKGRRASHWETILECSKREWDEEAGISLARLFPIQGGYVDDATLGVRYLVAICRNAVPGGGEPDARCLDWTPPREDAHDRDPIVKAHWIPVKDYCKGLTLARRVLLRNALTILDARRWTAIKPANEITCRKRRHECDMCASRGTILTDLSGGLGTCGRCRWIRHMCNQCQACAWCCSCNGSDE
jgi:8-oxo-dGTP pyrophosphatase MutT (NUDIX family)